MSSYALFRLPQANRYTLMEQTAGEPLALTSPLQLEGQQGFVIAPFAISSSTPLLLIRPDRVEVHPINSPPYTLRPFSGELVAAPCHPSSYSHPSTPSESYSADFNAFHAALCEGRFRKLVLARQATEHTLLTPLTLFHRACQLYPRLFIALVSTPQSGTWLTATPEVLIESTGHQWHTVALAGTMRLRDDELTGEGQHLRWSTKNIEEQRIVASYIADTLSQHGIAYSEEGPRTVRAANLVHLRSDFTFSFGNDSTLYNNICTRASRLLAALHPTPAVCGLPKDEAMSFILSHEHTPRLYYSGYMGPLGLNSPPCTLRPFSGESVSAPETHLFVSLRCMRIDDGGLCQLYAGGGLLRDSVCQKEWQETEAKLETMRSLLL